MRAKYGRLDDPDDLDDLDEGDEDLDVPKPPGRVAFTGQPSYFAKECLKQLGGYWDPPHKRWLVPEACEETARLCLTFAKQVGRLLTPEEAAEHLAAVREGLGIRRKATITCYECGKAYTVSQILQRHGDPADWYCGCEEPQNKPTRRAFGWTP